MLTVTSAVSPSAAGRVWRCRVGPRRDAVRSRLHRSPSRPDPQSRHATRCTAFHVAVVARRGRLPGRPHPRPDSRLLAGPTTPAASRGVARPRAGPRGLSGLVPQRDLACAVAVHDAVVHLLAIAGAAACSSPSTTRRVGASCWRTFAGRHPLMDDSTGRRAACGAGPGARPARPARCENRRRSFPTSTCPDLGQAVIRPRSAPLQRRRARLASRQTSPRTGGDQAGGGVGAPAAPSSRRWSFENIGSAGPARWLTLAGRGRGLGAVLRAADARLPGHARWGTCAADPLLRARADMVPDLRRPMTGTSYGRWWLHVSRRQRRVGRWAGAHRGSGVARSARPRRHRPAAPVLRPAAVGTMTEAFSARSAVGAALHRPGDAGHGRRPGLPRRRPRRSVEPRIA